MRILEGTIKNLLQGVSQQIPTARNEGQLGASLNMQADPITGIRRRWGWRKIAGMPTAPHIDANIMRTMRTFQYDLGFDRPRFISVLRGQTYFIWEFVDGAPSIRAYGVLNASMWDEFVATTLNGKLYLMSTPALVSRNTVEPSEINPDRQTNSEEYDPFTHGFFWIRSGAFSKKYEIRVKNGTPTGVNEQVFSYTTPDGTTAGDADKSVPSYICARLVEEINKGRFDEHGTIIPYTAYVTRTQDGVAYIGGSAYGEQRERRTVVESDAGTQYISVSGKMRVNLETDLPPWGYGSVSTGFDVPNYSIPVAVGQNEESAAYYRYDTDKAAWIETAAFDSTWYCAAAGMNVINPDDSVTFLRFEGRLAGNEDNNPTPPWLHDEEFQLGKRSLDAVTAMTSWQGRMLIASGGKVYCSAVGKPQRFYRSTVTELLEADRLIIESGSQRTGSIRGMFQQDKDLVLLADDVQTLIPAPNTPLSYKNVLMHSISQFMCDSRVAAVQVGPTKLYWNLRNGTSIGALELSSSQYTTSQYTTTDITQHIPTLFKCDRMFYPTVLGTSNFAAMLYAEKSTEPNRMMVHEYMFSSDGKVQSAWHGWDFDAPLYGMFNYQDSLYCMLRGVTGLDLYELSPLSERPDYSGNVSPTDEYHLDFWEAAKFTKHSDGVYSATITGGLARYLIEQNDFSKLRVAYARGASMGRYLDIVSITPQGDGASLVIMCHVNESVLDIECIVGLHIQSNFELTSPVLRDKDGQVIFKDTVRLLRLSPVLANTGEFSIVLKDKSRAIYSETKYTTIQTGSIGWGFEGVGEVDLSTVTVPCRVNALSATAAFHAFEAKALNVVGVDYLLQRPRVRQRV